MTLAPFLIALAITTHGRVVTSPEHASFSVSHGEDRFAAVYHDTGSDGTRWLRGRNYKASAASTGFAFVPFLGSDAPRNFPVRFRLREATRGAAPLTLAQEGVVTRLGDRIVVDRGEVRTRYDAAPDHVEQSFVLDDPNGVGPLTLRLSVETELSVAEFAGGFRFSNDWGGMTYGSAIAMDAAGRCVDVPMTWDHGEICLTVPSVFLDEALAPVVVDPLLTTFSVAGANVDLDEPDLVYFGGQTAAVVYEERFSATDVDVFTARITDNGSTSLGAYVDQTTDSWRRPRVASTGSQFTLLFVAEAPSPTIPGSTDIVARRRTQSGTFDPPFVLKGADPSYSCAAPVVAGDLYYQGFTFCIVYSRDYGAYRDNHAIVTGGSWTGSNTSDVAIAVSSAIDAGPPAISRATGMYADIHWLMAWSERELGTGASSVRSRRISYSGSGLSNAGIVAPPTTSALYFDVSVSDATNSFPLDSYRTYHAITYDDRPSNESDAFVTLSNTSSAFGAAELQVVEHVDRTANQDNLVAAATPGHLALAYVEEGSVYVTTVEPTDDTFGILERRLLVAGPHVVSGSLVALGLVEGFGGSSLGNSMLLWTDDSGGTTEIRGAVVSLPSERYAGGEQYCYGEPNSTGERGFLYATGGRIPGFPHQLHLESLPPGNFGYFLASLARGNLPGAGGSQGVLCVSGTVGRFGVFQVGPDGQFERTLDTAAIPQPNGPVLGQSGQVWNFQCWHRDSASGLPTSNFTNGTSIQFR